MSTPERRRFFLCATLLFASAGVRAQTGAGLPPPTGPNAVGTTAWVITDAARPESFDPGLGKRRIPVYAWYPAMPGAKGARAPYLRGGIEEVRAFATLIGKPGAFDGLEALVTHAILDAPVAKVSGKLPVIVFSHGYTGIPSSYTSVMEDLASHGFIVLSVVHPFEATAARLSATESVSMLDAQNTLRKELAAVIDEWKGDDDAMKAVTGLASEGERIERLSNYLSGLGSTHTALKRWVADTKAVLDMWSSTAMPLAKSLHAAADLSRIGAFGHSMGGVASGEFCLKDSRCRTAANLDGSPQSGSMIRERLKRPLLMVYSAREGRLGVNDAIYFKSSDPYFRVDVRSTNHLSFSDMPLWQGGGLRERGAYGNIEPAQIVRVTRTLVREFFEMILMRKLSPVLSEQELLPDVQVHPAERVR